MHLLFSFNTQSIFATMYLNAHSYFSLRYGTLSPQQLVQTAANQGATTLALTDINNTSAALEFTRKCQEQKIKPILGIEFRNDQHQLLFIGIAQNNHGWSQLCQLLTEHDLNSKTLPVTPPPLDQVYIIYPHTVKPLHLFRPNEFLGIRPSQVNQLPFSLYQQHANRLVVWQPITFLHNEGYRLHKLLRAIDANTLVTKLDQVELAQADEYPKSIPEIHQAFTRFPKILQNTQKILESCSFTAQTGLQLNRQAYTGSKEGDLQLLSKLAQEGSLRRYGPNHRKAQERIKKELTVIAEMDFGAYFLITWDIIRYAQTAGYHHVGRGSGANSIVAYCLFITDVEPLELDLYFERFINPQRSSPPDFDIDFSWDERNDVTDYIFKRYGREHTALLATYSTFQQDAVLRELGKALGLQPSEIEAILEYATAQKRGLPLDDSNLHPWTKHILHYGQQLINFPNYLSIHAGGIIISEQPLHHQTALKKMPKGFPITHFDMYGAEDWGFHKFDVLSQRGLGHIKDCITLVQENQGQIVHIHDVERLKNDEKVRAKLRSSQCMGCFYIESPAMRGLLRKLRCDNYIHLVAASSIIRPGVASSGMMRAYLQRYHQPNAFEYPHPVFQEHLSETFGVMVYQEDVMKILHHFAGLGLDEADVMRRMMTGKKRSSEAFARLKQRYFDQCAARKYPESLSQEVWRQIESFGGYSFCKAHSASFAVESFQSLYLKTYFPLEFMVAVINNFGGFYHTEYYVHEARMAGATIHAPCVNHSNHLTCIQGKDIYIGFIHLRGLESHTAQLIEQQRKEFGPFQSLDDFVRRVPVKSSQLDLLIRIGAFRFTELKKGALLWEKSRVLNPDLQVGTPLLFEEEHETYTLPELSEYPLDQAFDELELLGFPLCSPFDMVEKTELEKGYGLPARKWTDHVSEIVQLTGYYVCRKETRTTKGDLMQFGTWLDQEGQFCDTVHFPDAIKQYPFRGRGVYRLRGRLTSDFGFVTLEVFEMHRLPYQTDQRYVQ